MGDKILDIVLIVFLLSIVVLLVKNPSGSTQLFNSLWGGVQGESKILSGG